MKARILLLLAVAAIAVAESDRHVTDTMKALNKLRAQQAKWMSVLKGKSGYIMHTASGQHFLDHNETLSQKVCGEKEPHLIGQDKASLPPQARGQHGGQNKKHLLGQDKASLPPQFRGGHNKEHLLGQDEASLPPQFRGRHNKEHRLGEGKDDKRHRRSATGMVGQDQASLPPAYNPVSHSVSDVFGVLKNVLQKSCSVTVQYHKQMGYPVNFNVTACKEFPALVKHIVLPKVTIVDQKSNVASKVCSKPKAVKHTALVLVQHIQALATLSLPPVNPAPIAAAAKKSVKNIAVLLRNKSVGPAQEIVKQARKAAAVVAKMPIPLLMPGPVLLPAKPTTPVKKQQHPRAELGRKTGTNPAVFTDIKEKKKPEHHDHKPEHHDHKPEHHDHKPEHHDHKPEHHDHKPEHHDHKPEHHDHKPEHHGRKPEHHDRKPENHGDRHGPHHGDHHGDDHHHGGDKWMFIEDDGKFSHFWHSKARQFRHFVMKHPWVLPTSFAALGLLTSGIILLAVHYARKRRAARSHDGHALLVNEDKKVLIDDDDDQQTASVYVNQVTA